MGLAKTMRPNARKAIPRPRLFKLLDEGRRRPLTWVWGPPGAGKTTLVATYLDARRLRGLWYQLDAGDNDLGSFFYYLKLAASDVAGQAATTLPLLTPESLGDGVTFARRFWRELCAGLRPPFVLVFDNYQDVPADSALHEALGHGLREVPDGGQAILISRTEPPPAFARFRANGAAAVLGWEELKLTEAETAAFVGRRPARPSADAVRALYETTDGWAAGIVLMGDGHCRGRGPAPRPQTPQVVFDYFAAEIFERTDRVAHDVLLQTAYLPRVTAAMAEALTGHAAAGRVLADLQRANYFVTRYSGNGHPEPDVVYQYHPLFRTFLLGRAHEVFTVDRRSEIQRASARLLEGSGRVEDAAELLAEARDWDGFARIIAEHAPVFCTLGRHRTVDAWIRRLPADRVESDPWLLFWRGTARSPFEPSGVRCEFEQALEGFRARGDAAGAYLAWSAIVMSFMFERDNSAPVDGWIDTLDDLRAQFPVFPTREIETQVTVMMFAALAMRQPYPPAIDEWAERAWRLSEDSRDVNFQMRVGFFLLDTYESRGHFVQAALVADRLRPLVRARGVCLEVQVIAVSIARLDWLTGAFASCREIAEAGLRTAGESGAHVFRSALAVEKVCADLSEGDHGRAASWLASTESQLDRLTAGERGQYHYVKGWHALLRNDLEAAFVEQERAAAAARKLGAKWPECLAGVLSAQVLHRRRAREEAEKRLATAAEIATRLQSHLLQFMIALTEADWAFGDGDIGRGTEALRKAMAIGREKGYVNTWTWLPSTMASLCVRAIEAGIEVEYVRHLVRKRRLVPERPPIELEHWPWPVEVRTLGRVEVFRDGQPVEASRKSQRRPLELLRALIAFGGEDVVEERVADVLWPEADGDAAQQALATTLHRLRRLLGDDQAVLRRDGRLTLEARHCWVDAEAVQHCLARAESAAHGRARGDGWRDSAAWTDRALSLYKGDFVADEREPWAMAFAERLRTRLRGHLERVGAHRPGEARTWQQAAQRDGQRS